MVDFTFAGLILTGGRKPNATHCLICIMLPMMEKNTIYKTKKFLFGRKRENKNKEIKIRQYLDALY